MLESIISGTNFGGSWHPFLVPEIKPGLTTGVEVAGIGQGIELKNNVGVKMCLSNRQTRV